jgi:type IV pilus assembly protein PilO
MKSGVGQLLFTVLMLGLLAASYFFVFQPASAKRAARQAEIAEKRKVLADLRLATAGVKDWEDKLKELGEAIKFFESKLPQEKEVDKLLKSVWQLAEANHLQTKTIKTLRSERFAGYSEQPIQVSLSGEFKPGFYSFLLQLEKLARITRIGQMKLEKINARDGEMQAQVTLSIFFESDGRGASYAGAQ